MKILQLLVYKVLARVLDTVNNYFNVRRLRYYREVIQLSVEVLNQQIYNESKLMAKRKALYAFRPFEVNEVDYRSTSSQAPRCSGCRQFPKARSGHRIVCSDSALYCFGGFNPNSPTMYIVDNQNLLADIANRAETESCLYEELWKYDMVRKQWTLLMDAENDLPIELASNAMLLYGDTIMIFGGTGFPFGMNCSNKLYVCQTGNKPKEMLEIEVSGDLPQPLYGQGIVCNDNYLYSIGGTDGFDYTLDIHRLHLPTRTWECAYECRPNIRDDPLGRYRHELAYDDSNIYVIGGGTSDSVFMLSTIPVYDMNANKWEYCITKPDPNAGVPGVPAARKCHSCVQLRTEKGVEVVVAGGYDGVSYFRDIWKLNLSSLEWKLMQKSTLPHPLFFHDAATTSDGCMYIFGGIKFNNNVNIRTNMLYKMWTTIPRLSVIAWEALLHYIPSLHSKTKEELLELGIPIQFVNRVHD